MASGAGSRSGKKNTTTSSRTRSTANQKNAAKNTNDITNEIILIGVFALSVLLFLCNFGVIGPVGNAVSSFMFGLFGMIAYVVPILVFVGLGFGISNKGNFFASMKIGASVLLVLLIGVVLELISGPAISMDKYSIVELYQFGSESKLGGGVLSGSLAYLMNHFLGTVGAVVLVLVLAIISFVIITEKSFVGGVKKQSRKVYETARADVQLRKERAQERALKRQEEDNIRRQKEEADQEERKLRMEKKVSGVMLNTELTSQKQAKTAVQKPVPKPAVPEMKEPVIREPEVKEPEKKEQEKKVLDFSKIKVHMSPVPEAASINETVVNKKTEREETVDLLAEKYKDADVFRDMRVITPDRKVITSKPVRELVFRDFHQEEIPMEAIAPERYSAAVARTESAGNAEEQIRTGDSFAEEYFREEYVEEIPEEVIAEDLQEEITEEGIVDEIIPGVLDQEEKILFREMDFTEENFHQETMFEEAEDEVVEKVVGKTDSRPKAILPKQGHASAPVLDKNGKIVPETQSKPISKTPATQQQTAGAGAVKKTPVKQRPYQYPPITLLEKIENNNRSDVVKELQNTAEKLQQILEIFGVKVTITEISQGPAITRYELQPEMGVKVSKILSLSDDIKMHLAATDIRIEAPIPGKAAIGIEVPNKESSMVGLRELLESSEFKEASSKITFAVGKDIAGKVVVHDIAKMPHMLVAGSTGSGKSVCINTLIMSILYKAKPDEVKLILIDPKVVELSVYNGIPHLLIPVVTDPKQASSALQWAVAEMTDRYQKFADYNVRDLKGFNKKVADMKERGEENVPDKLPQIVIIVDELADLMMVAPGEVEEYICRLAQLARACGIHLVIATQRPSVDVITGLIKNNMSSRIAFAVTSGVDSRTILDMNGAEKLLGKGDMLFAPMGYPKPARLQGAFVSDNEVSNVVDYLKNQVIGNVYDEQILDKVKNMSSGGGNGSSGNEGEERDPYFEKVARFIIEKDKASIGMLQRAFKIGFNRAARIMDQLADAGVVGEEEGTKPRKILMSEEQFEQFVEDYL